MSAVNEGLTVHHRYESEYSESAQDTPESQHYLVCIFLHANKMDNLSIWVQRREKLCGTPHVRLTKVFNSRRALHSLLGTIEIHVRVPSQARIIR